jgi:hypothetical protein
MSTKDTSEPAFPYGQISEQTGLPINGFFNPGITERKLIAAMAMQGLLASSQHGAPDPQSIAERSTRYADALLAELAK